MLKNQKICLSNQKGVVPLIKTDIVLINSNPMEEEDEMLAHSTAYCCFESCIQNQIVEYAKVIGQETFVGKWRTSDSNVANASKDVPLDTRSIDELNDIRK